MDANKICAVGLLEEDASDLNDATDIADNIFQQSIDMAQHVIGNSEALRRDVLALATAHAQAATHVYMVNKLAAVLRELAPEIAGAISEAGTDVGSGIVQGLQALKPRMRTCNQATASTTGVTP
ncbi:MAG: hypothetical protein A3I66_19080 [Burkholderiales bacterium RIFCSPLOWO2_02_FULL_57_36]|nr:MAG: hypothetical protein A3I66_19080 [Burkholderiales bacterium RIFCSPLOWO2_02_FULL_57_36]